MGTQLTEEEKLYLIKNDFRYFMQYIFRFQNIEPTPIQYEMAEFLQYGAKEVIVQAFREFGKSITIAAFICWKWLNDSNIKFFVCSCTPDKAVKISTQVKRLLAIVPLLQHLRPQKEKEDRDSVLSFDVSARTTIDQDPSFKCCGVFSSFTGSHATYVIADDVENPNNSETQLKRENLEERIKELYAVAGKNGNIIWIGTPQTTESIYNKLREKGIKRKVWPILYPDYQQALVYGGDLAESIVERIEKDHSCIGHSTDPVRYPDEEIDRIRGRVGDSWFNLHYMLDTTLSDALKYPLKLSDLIVMELNSNKAPITIQYASSPELVIKEFSTYGIGHTGDKLYRPIFVDKDFIPYTGSVMAIDPSGKGKNLTSYVVIKTLHGKAFLTAVGGFVGGYEDSTLIKLATVAKEQKVNAIVLEENYGGGMFTALFKPILAQIHPCMVEEVRHSTQKEARIIDTLEPVLNNHKLVVDYQVLKKDITQESKVNSLFYQMAHLTRTRNSLIQDDMIDVLAIAIKYFQDSVTRDEKRALELYREEQLDREIAELYGGKSQYHNFLKNF